MFRLLLIALLLVVSQSADAASPKKKPKVNVYPAEERRQFMSGCTNGSNEMYDFCSCIMIKFQETMTFEEFGAMNNMTDEQLRKHAPYAGAIIGCSKRL